jgi:hypothetical protein
MLNFYPPFLCRVLATILKMADILKILKMQNEFIVKEYIDNAVIVLYAMEYIVII